MVIAVACREDRVLPFGGAPEFTIFTVESGVRKSRDVVPVKQLTGKDLAELLCKLGIELVICGALDEVSRAALDGAGVYWVSGASGKVDEAFAAYLTGRLKF